MKKILLTAIFCMSMSFVFSQQDTSKPSFRINVYTLYAFDDSIDSYYSNTSYFNGKLKGGFEWGGGLEYMVRPDYGLELSYFNLNSSAPMEYYDPGSLVNPKHADFDVTSNYIMLGGNRYVRKNEKVEPYGGLQLGMAIFDVKNPTTGATDSSTKFAWGARLGTNIWLSPKVGIKLQASLLSAVQAVGGTLYFGTGGAGAGAGAYSSLLQFNLGGGLTFNLGDK